MPDFSIVERLSLSGKRVVVAGGTQGIGAGIARFAAHLGASVAIIGRNSALGNDLIGGFHAGDAAATRSHLFISADLSTIRGSKEAAKRVKDWAGDSNVDLLFQTQGGPPSATETVTEDGLEFRFAVQVMSRFIIPYVLAELGALRDSTVLLVAEAGDAPASINFDNIDAKGLSWLTKVQHSSAVLDAITLEFNKRYSSFRVLHTRPGFVRTNVAVNSNTPWFFRIAFTILLSLPLVSRTPDQYARVAIWIATSEDVKRQKDSVSWTQNGTEATLSPVAVDDKQRERVWEKLVGMVDRA